MRSSIPFQLPGTAPALDVKRPFLRLLFPQPCSRSDALPYLTADADADADGRLTANSPALATATVPHSVFIRNTSHRGPDSHRPADDNDRITNVPKDEMTSNLLFIVNVGRQLWHHLYNVLFECPLPLVTGQRHS